MWTALFPNWKTYKYYFTDNASKKVLEKLLKYPFTLKIIKNCPSHLLFYLTFFHSESPSLFLKLYKKRPFKKNRPKSFLKKYHSLKNLGIPVLPPTLIFFHPRWSFKSYSNPFIGGLLFPYIKEGFLTENSFSKGSVENSSLLPNLVHFLFQLHEKGLYLGDTKYNNFLYREKSFLLFDLDGLKILNRPLTLRERLEDLAPLAMTLEWQGIENISQILFNLYKVLYPLLSRENFPLFKALVKKRLYKRFKKLNLLSYKQDSNVSF